MPWPDRSGLLTIFGMKRLLSGAGGFGGIGKPGFYAPEIMIWDLKYR
jgi:hypothetical protein